MANIFDQFDAQTPAFTAALTPSADARTTDPAAAAQALGGQSVQTNPFDQFDENVSREAPTKTESGIMGAVQGATLGFADELFAATESARLKLSGDERSFGELFDLHQRAGSQEFTRAQEENPVSFGAGQVGGGLGTALVAGPAGLVARTAGAGLATRAGAGAIEGAGFGAISGAGITDGGVRERAVGAGQGLVTGAALGGAIPVAATAIGAGVRAAGRQVKGAATTATGLIADRLKNAQTELRRALQKLDRVRKTNPNTTLADVGGPEVQELLRAAGNVPSEARSGLLKKLSLRKQFQFKRLADALGVASGGSTDEFFETLSGLGKVRKSAAKKMFDRAFSKPIPFSRALEDVLKRPIVRAALVRARTAAQNRGEDFEQQFAREIGQDADGIPLFEITSVPGVRDLHRVKMELDSIIGNLKKRLETSNIAGVSARDATIAKKALVDAIESPAYKRALAQYAGDSAAINAAEEGLEFFKKRPDEIKGIIEGFTSETEKQMFRMGAARALVDQVRNRSINRDAVGPVLENAQNIERIKVIFPTAARRELQRIQAIENAQSRTVRAVQGNSTTARQLLESQRASGAGDALAAGADILTGGAAGASVANAARRTLSNVIGERLRGLSPDVADEVIRQLTSADDTVIQEVSARLQRLTAQQLQALQLSDLAILGLTPAAVNAAQGLAAP